MKSFCILFIAMAVSAEAASLVDLALEEWKLFKLEYHKNYSLEEEQDRLKIFIDTRTLVAKHNYEYDLGHVPYKLEINEYADMSFNELQKRFCGYKSPKLLKSSIGYDPVSKPITPTYIPPANVKLPESVDWRDKGAVTPVKDQKHCGSCWAFATTGVLEAQHFRKTNKLVSLSEQNLIDCSKDNLGCDGGFMDRAYNYIHFNDGIDTEESYPFEGSDKQCRYNGTNAGAIVSGYVNIASGNEEHMKASVATIGPIAVAINANTLFTRYSEGVFHDETCSKTELNHAVLIVGYGKEQTGEEYWLVKNSWGTDFGDNGYIKMQRNTNQCGIASHASFPLV